MKSVPLTAFARSQVKRTGLKLVRGSGRVPAVIYGRQAQPQNLEVNRKELEDLIHHSASENLLVDLSVTEDPRPKRLALVKEVQHHPLKDNVLHVDLQEVSETEKVIVMVPVEAVGEALGVKTGGGILETILHKIKVRALPKDLPEVLQIDVSHLEIGKAVHVGDIKPPAGVEVLGDKHVSVMAVAAPISEAEEQAALETAAPGEVEMIKEKKEEGEAGAAPAKPGAAPAKAGEKAPAAAAAAPGKAGAAPAKPGAAPAAGAAEKKPAEKKK